MNVRLGFLLVSILAIAAGVLALALVALGAPSAGASSTDIRPAPGTLVELASSASLTLVRSGSIPRLLQASVPLAGTFSAVAEFNLTNAASAPGEPLTGSVRLLDSVTRQPLFQGNGNVVISNGVPLLGVELTGSGSYQDTRLTLAGPLTANGSTWRLPLLTGLAVSTVAPAVVEPEASPLPWYLTRAAGLTGWWLLCLAVIAGVLVRTRAASGGLRFGMFELHQSLAIAALGFSLVHAGVLLTDRFIGYSPVEVLVPFAAAYEPIWTAAGIIGLYLLIGIVASFFLRDWIGYRSWRVIHYATYVLFTLGLIHAVFMGTDVAQPWVLATMLAGAAAAVTLTLYRIAVTLRRPERRGLRPAALPTDPEPVTATSPLSS